MSFSIKLSVDNSAFNKLVKEMRTTIVEAGWLQDVEHWNKDNGDEGVSIPLLASHLHYHSKWADSFMFSAKRAPQVNAIVQRSLSSAGSFQSTAGLIGKHLESQLRKNIEAVTSPQNDPEWAAHKRNNKPLQWGSLNGSTPNLISTISSSVNSL